MAPILNSARIIKAVCLLLCISPTRGFGSIFLDSTANSGSSLLSTKIRKRVHNVSRGGDLKAFDRSDSENEGNDDATARVEIVKGSFGDNAAKQAKPMSNIPLDEYTRTQLGKSYLISTVMWVSLALDTFLNKRKRALLFPDTIPDLVSSFSVASGFIMAAGIAYTLSIDLKSEWLSSDNGTSGEGFRNKLHSLLFMFSIVTLGANLNPASAPFLGFGAAIIHIHNAMIAYNAWSKEIATEGKTVAIASSDTLKSMIASFVRSPNKSIGTISQFSSTTYFAVTFVSILRGFKVLTKSLVPHYLSCFSAGSLTISSVSTMRFIGLEWAQLSRALLVGGVSLLLKEECDQGQEKRTKGYRILNGILSTSATFVAVPYLLTKDMTAIGQTLKLLILATVSGYNCIRY